MLVSLKEFQWLSQSSLSAQRTLTSSAREKRLSLDVQYLHA